MNPSIIPCRYYDDAPAAIEWLCSVLGFEKHLVVPGDDGTITHSQLTRPGGMLMVSSRRGDDRRPNTDIYVVVPDADAVHARAKAVGADVGDVIDHDYGGRGFPLKDLEGNAWYVGSYDPYAPPKTD